MYYPKSQITPNQYTSGNEFIIASNSSPYVGYYYKVSTGKYYTGRNPDDRPNEELIFTLVQDYTDDQQNRVIPVEPLISALTNVPISVTPTYLPYYSPVIPTTQNYQNGEFQRYFCKKVNEIIYIEINLDQYTKLKSKSPEIEYSLFFPFTITWVLTGNKEQVAKTNKNIVELAIFKQKLPRFGEYIRFDYLKYYNQSGSTNVLADRKSRTNSIFNDASTSGSIHRDNSLSQFHTSGSQ
jgi:hypothetical protein